MFVYLLEEVKYLKTFIKHQGPHGKMGYLGGNLWNKTMFVNVCLLEGVKYLKTFPNYKGPNAMEKWAIRKIALLK